MTKAELLRFIKALEQGAPAVNIAFEHERLLHDLQVHQVELETQNRELREAQLLLEGSRDRYADLYDFAPVGYLTLNDKGIIQEINLTAAGMLGVERTRLVGVPFHLHVARGDLAQFRKHLGRPEDLEERVTTELHLVCKGGNALPVVMQSRLLYDVEKRTFLCRAALTDITERKQAERAVREQEARLRAVLDAAVDGIITIDERGTIESLNPAAVKMFGYPADQLMGQNISLLMPSPHREQHDRYLTNYRATGERKIIGIGREVSGRRKDGSTFPLDLSVSEVQLQGRRIFTGFVRDITQRKEAERLLRESGQRYRTLVEASPDAILVLKHGRIDFVNPQGLRLLGAKSPAELIGRSFFDLVTWDQHAVLRERVVEAERPGGASPLIEDEILRSDGSRRWVSLSAAMFPEQGETAMQLILRDITERKELEKAILEVSEREQRRLGHDLHDGLGQRLTGLEMLSHGLAEDLEGIKPALTKQAHRLNRELRETVTDARLISHSLAPVPLSGDGLMRGLSELASFTSRLPGVKCRFSCAPPVLVKETTTATHLYRIAQEAVTNALKHGRAKQIEIVLKEEAGVTELSVQNNGRPLSARSKSFGVGLNVMRYRAEAIGASLSVESAGRKGVKVKCVLKKT